MAIVLRKNPYDLIQIYEKRNYSDSKKNDNLGSEILGVIAYDSIEYLVKKKRFKSIQHLLQLKKLRKKLRVLLMELPRETQ